LKEVSILRKKLPTAKKPSSKLVHAIPDEALETLARCLLPAMRSYFESVEGWRIGAWGRRNPVLCFFALLVVLKCSGARLLMYQFFSGKAA
jgi:hypothetical protein